MLPGASPAGPSGLQRRASWLGTHLHRLEPGGVASHYFRYSFRVRIWRHVTAPPPPAQSPADDVGGVHGALGAAGAHVVWAVKRIIAGLLTSSSNTAMRSSTHPVLWCPPPCAEVRDLVQHLRRGRVAHNDLPGQPLSDGGFAHTRLPIRQGVVLGAAGEIWFTKLDLPVPVPMTRVQLPARASAVQSRVNSFQGLVLAVILRGLVPERPDRRPDLRGISPSFCIRAVYGDGHPRQLRRGRPVVAFRGCRQQVLRAQVVDPRMESSICHSTTRRGVRAWGGLLADRNSTLLDDLHDHVIGEARTSASRWANDSPVSRGPAAFGCSRAYAVRGPASRMPPGKRASSAQRLKKFVYS